MDGPVTVRDVMDRTYPAVSEGDPVRGAADLMCRDGVEAVVVLRGQEAVGVLRAFDVVALVADGADLDGTTVDEAMVGSVPSIDAAAAVTEAASVFVEAGTRWAVVEDGGAVVGMLSEHDVVAARATFPDEEEFERPSGPPDDPTTSEAEPAELEGETATAFEDGMATQGVCEVCGSLSRPLHRHNGQLVCSDCLEA